MADEKIFNAEFYHKLNTFRMSMKMRLAAGMNGGRKSNAKGNSVEFSDFREYILGDDIRRIDWNAYGRFDRLFVKLFMEEKEGVFRIFVDGSKSMDFGEKAKSVCAQRIAAALSYCVLENSDRLILNIMQGNGLTVHKGVTGRQAFAKTIERLEQINFDGEADLLSCIKRSNIKQRGVSIVISDFYTENLEDILKYLTFSKQEVILIQVLSPEAVNPGLEGTLNLLDSETNAGMRITMSSALDKEYKSNYNDFINHIDTVSRKYAASYLRVMSDESLDSIFFGTLSRLS